MSSARQQGLIGCSCCALVQQRPQAHPRRAIFCSRCHSRLHSRLPNAVAKSWAYTLAALVMLLPANFYPIMVVTSLGSDSPDTIISGVIHLVHSGQYPIAAVVFIASIAVPVLKLIGMMLLLTATQRHWHLSARQCTALYRMVEFIGRWSMLDLFVIAILMALVDLGQVAQINAGPAATAFLVTVLLTMLAAISFDPRLLWDLHHPSDSDDADLCAYAGAPRSETPISTTQFSTAPNAKAQL